MQKKPVIEVRATQGQGSVELYKGTDPLEALLILYESIGSGSIGLFIDGRSANELLRIRKCLKTS